MKGRLVVSRTCINPLYLNDLTLYTQIITTL